MKMSAEQLRVIELANQFCDEYFTEDKVKVWVLSGGIPNHVREAFYQNDLGKYLIPTNAGGKDCTFLERVTLCTELTRRAGATVPFLSDAISMALFSTLRRLSQAEILEEHGPTSFSQAFTEPNAGTDSQAVRTVVSTDEDGIYLDGVKTFVSCGEFLSQTLVLARDPILGQRDGGMSLWLVPIKSDGISILPLNAVGQEMMCPAVLSFSHVKLAPHWQIQTEGKLNSILKRQYGLGRILVCASSLGLAMAALGDALEYSSEHIVKGRVLNSLPQIQEKLADMEVKIRSIHMFVREAAISAEGKNYDTFMLNTSLMKRFVPMAASEVASEALQIFGGIGYTDATRVSRIWRDCRGNQIAQGTDEVMVGLITKEMIKKKQHNRW